MDRPFGGISAGSLLAIWRRVAAPVAAAAGVVWALCSSNGLVDDAYITLRYAENWGLHGDLVWNAGERVEGYSNFLWMAILAGAQRLGLWPELAAQVIGLTCFALTVMLVARFANLYGGRSAGWISGLLVGLNWSHVQLATMGLETPLQLLLLAGLMNASVGARHGEPRAQVSASLLSALGFLTRMDFVLLAVPWLAWILLPHASRDWRRRGGAVVRTVLPGLAVAVLWLVWKLFYYGSIIPTTAAVKLGGGSQGFAVAYLLQGFAYTLSFLLLYGILPAVLLGLAPSRLDGQPILPLLTAALFWFTYLLHTGGDWIEFRFALPFLILLAPVAATGVGRLGQLRRITWLALLLGCSFWMSREYGRLVNLTFVAGRAQIAADTRLWSSVGRRLRAVFPSDMWHGGRLQIATTAAGAVPYYSRLRTYDLVGLNTPEVAREGVRHFALPGHAYHATVKMAERAGVHLVLGRPDSISLRQWTSDPRNGCRLQPRYFYHGADGRSDEKGTVLGLPLSRDAVVPMWYLSPSVDVERAIEAGNLLVLPCP